MFSIEFLEAPFLISSRIICESANSLSAFSNLVKASAAGSSFLRS